MSDYTKIYNPDPKDMKVRVEDTYLVIPANGYAIVSNLIGVSIQNSYAQLEIGPATLEDYQAYRILKDKAEKELFKKEEERKKIEIKTAKEEAIKVEKKIAARELGARQAREKEAEQKIAVINNEKEAIKQVKETIVVEFPNNSKKLGKKGK